MRLRLTLLWTVLGLLFLGAPGLHAQYRDDQFKRDAFSQNYADTSQTAKTDSSQLFSFKEYFGALAHKNTASLKTLSMGSAVLVGGTQIYHKQYWKLPLIYGGIGAGVAGGIYFNNQYKTTGDTKFQTYSTLSYVGAGLVWWGSLMDGAVCYDRGMHPDPSKSTLYSLLLPGLGQIYNGEFWKVPLYLGLMAGSVHFCVDNNVQYQRWKWIHNMATTDDETVERPPQSGETAKYYRDVFRRYRDYSILAIVLSYVIQVVDANVFAYMQDFEVNDDISLRLEPSVMPVGNSFAAAPPAVGMSIGLKF
ncbi:MAG: hypothetical protein II171_08365 [Bacteroidales bacterium]|nr:hypothetical protein [Bacteroidales bacterium]